MENTNRLPKRPRTSQPVQAQPTGAQDSEFWQFLDSQHNGAVSQPTLAPSAHAATHANASLDAMLLEHWDQPNETQLNIRLPAAAKRMIERLARRKTVGVSTLVRMWVIECLRKEVSHLPGIAFREQ